MFIAFEGIDGAGKSTIIVKLEEALKLRGLNVLVTREPGGIGETPLGNKLRELVLENRELNLSAHAEALVFALDRRIHLEAVVWPALAKGHIVLCDRHIDSSIAYQGAREELSVERVKLLQDFVTDGRVPDVTLYFDITPPAALKRLQNRGALDKIEQGDEEYLLRVYRNYKLIMRDLYPGRKYIVFDATLPEADVYAEVEKAVLNLLAVA